MGDKDILYTSKLVCSILYEFLLALATFPLLFLPTFAGSSKQTSYKSVKQHEGEVRRISAELSNAFQLKRLVVLHRKPGEGHSARSAAYKKGRYGINIASLCAVLSLDLEDMTISVQSGITFEQLCVETLKHGLLPLVVPEFKSITVGGAIQGIGIESSSWHNGAFDESVVEATIVLGDGTVRSSKHVPDLWRHVPGSNGTLALVVAATLKLARATDWVRVTYTPRLDLQAYIDQIDQMHKRSGQWSWTDQHSLIDSMWIRDQGIVSMSARCIEEGDTDWTESCKYVENPFSPFFFQHVVHIARSLGSSQSAQHTEYMPTIQYLFRYDRGGVCNLLMEIIFDVLTLSSSGASWLWHICFGQSSSCWNENSHSWQESLITSSRLQHCIKLPCSFRTMIENVFRCFRM